MVNLAVSVFIKRSLSVSISPIRFGLLAFASVILINLAINPVGRLEAIIGSGSLYLVLSIWAYFLSQLSDHKIKQTILFAVTCSSAILSLHTIAQLTFLYKIASLPIYMQSRSFSLTGVPLTTFILIILGGAVSLYLTLNHTKSKALLTFSTIIHTIAIVSLGALLLPGQELALNLLPLRASWNIALDAMKTSRTFFLGIGLPNFPMFYSSVKPLFINSTSFWNLIPNTSSSELLQILTTTGVLGFLSFISIPIIAFQKSNSTDPVINGLKILAVLSLIALALSPGSIPILFIYFSVLGVLASTTPRVIPIPAPNHYIVSLIILGIVSTIGYYTTQVIRAESNIRNAQIALNNNDGKTLYEQIYKAIQILPNLAGYHLTSSQVNLSLATALSQKESLSDAQRENVSTLVSQAITEGKSAISLSPNDARVWQNLGAIYQKLINVAQGSEGFAIEAYSQAIKLDPGNPILRLEYGGLLYQLAQTAKKPEDQNSLYGRAQSEFQTVIQLKPDYPNAYYNLAKLLESAKDYSNASIAMQKAISLLGPDNPSLSKANAELEAIKAKIPKSTPAPSVSPSPTPSPIGNPDTSISTPTPLPSPISGGPIEITPDSTAN